MVGYYASVGSTAAGVPLILARIARTSPPAGLAAPGSQARTPIQICAVETVRHWGAKRGANGIR